MSRTTEITAPGAVHCPVFGVAGPLPVASVFARESVVPPAALSESHHFATVQTMKGDTND
jgi:hypothetical protein